MSASASASVVAVGGCGEVGFGVRPPFTAVQWQELEHQAMIYKYLVAGLPVPPDLVMPIRRSFNSLSSGFFQYPSLGYCSYYGKKFDPEPGRCRRTDGKKWRCSKDAHPESKYCERHMHRGRNRSRKPVETQSSAQSLSTAISHISTGYNSASGSFQASGSGSFPNMPLYSASSEGSTFGNNVTKLQMEPVSYSIHDKELRYIHGLAPDSDEHVQDASVTVGSLGLGTSAGSSTWNLMPSQLSSSSLLRQKPESRFLSHSYAQQTMLPSFNATMPKGEQQHCFLGNGNVSPGTVKPEGQNPVHPFFSEWPTTKESWSNLDADSSKNSFSSTKLSISIPRGNSDFSSKSSYSPNDT